MKKRKRIYIPILVIFIAWFIIHISPTNSLRFKVLLHGFPKEAFSSKIIKVREVIEKNKNLKFYQLDPTTVSKDTGTMNFWEVRKKGPFYFSRYYGS